MSARALIFNMNITSGKTFPCLPTILTLEFGLLFENVNLSIMFEQWVLELSYISHEYFSQQKVSMETNIFDLMNLKSGLPF